MTRHSTRFTLYVMAAGSAEADERFKAYFEKFGTYNAEDHYEDLFFNSKPKMRDRAWSSVQ
jgi:5,5'-dehydrodivanillate O-demethylase